MVSFRMSLSGTGSQFRGQSNIASLHIADSFLQTADFLGPIEVQDQRCDHGAGAEHNEAGASGFDSHHPINVAKTETERVFGRGGNLRWANTGLVGTGPKLKPVRPRLP
jgi:hypothetical protein